MRWLDGIVVSTDMSLSKLQETVKAGKPGVLQSMELQRVGHNFANEQQQIDNVIKLEFSLVSFLSQRTQLDVDGVSSMAVFVNKCGRGAFSLEVPRSKESSQ